MEFGYLEMMKKGKKDFSIAPPTCVFCGLQGKCVTSL